MKCIVGVKYTYYHIHSKCIALRHRFTKIHAAANIEMVSKKDPTAWLDNAFFEKVLRQAFNDKAITVEDFFISLNTDSSTQYASTIFRTTVSYWIKGKVESIPLIVKLTSSKVNQLADANVFDNELNLYKYYIGPMEDLLAQAGYSNSYFAPKLLYASAEPQPVIILEDVTHKHFELYKSSMNFEDTKVIAEKLARFHAASFCLLKNGLKKTSDDPFSGLFKANPSQGVKFMEENFSIFAEEIAKWEGFEKYAEKLEKLASKFLQRGIEIYNPEVDRFSVKVLNHGDFHYNNMLLKFDGERASVSDVLFIDFQLSFWGTPAVDLLYLLYLVSHKQARDEHRQELIYYYHQKFVDALEKMGYVGSVPTLLDLNNDLLRAGFLEVVIVVCFIPFLFADYSTALNVYGETNDTKAYRRQLYSNPQYLEILEPLLPFFLHKGFLD